MKIRKSSEPQKKIHENCIFYLRKVGYKSSSIYIFDNKNQYIIGINEQNGIENIILKNSFETIKPKIIKFPDSSNFYVFSVLSEAYPWRYLSLVPTSIVMNKIHYIIFFCIILVFISLSIGIFSSYFFTCRLFNPINTIINKIFDKSVKIHDGTNFNVYSFLESSFNNIISKNEELEKKIKYYRPIATELFFLRVLQRSPDKVDLNIIDQLPMKFIQTDFWSVIMFFIEKKRNDINFDSHFLKDTSLDNFSFYILKFDNKKIVAITNRYYDDELKLIINTVSKHLLNIEGISNIFTGVGNRHKGIRGINQSYSEALIALNYSLLKIKKGNSLSFYSNIQKKIKVICYYPLEEKKLINNLKIGNYITFGYIKSCCI